MPWIISNSDNRLLRLRIELARPMQHDAFFSILGGHAHGHADHVLNVFTLRHCHALAFFFAARDFTLAATIFL
jgi:hypothetical protein